ncbi:MAG TPA: hypothetical protein VLW84_06495 [Terriglobales bacterium]|nr:hypothetical protein [Terriglobales bacterium]
MSSIQEVSAEELAKLFHHYQEALSQDFTCGPGPEQVASWEQTPQNEKKRMIAAARLALLEMAANERDGKVDRRYFAKPGEADWGC